MLLPRHIAWWESFIAFLVILQVIFLPYILAFTVEGGYTLYVLEFVVDILFICDMLIQFNVAYRIEIIAQVTGESNSTAELERRLEQDQICQLETRRSYIAGHYVRTWFLIDFLAIIPIFVTSQGGLSLTKTLRLPRLFRLLKVARVVRKLKSNSKMRRFLLYSKYTSAFR